MKTRSLSAAILAVALGAAGLAATAPVATAAAGTASATSTASSNGTTITASTFDQLTGTERTQLWPDVIALNVDVPDPYFYYSTSGYRYAVEVGWTAKAFVTGDPSCVHTYGLLSGTGDGGKMWGTTLYQDTAPGKCFVQIDVWASRYVKDQPAASYEAHVTTTVPLNYYAKSFFTDVTTSKTSVAKGSSTIMAGKIKYDAAYSLRSAPPLAGAQLDVEETTGNPSDAAAKWTRIGGVKSGPDGGWRIAIKPSRTASYRVTYKGSELILSSSTSPSPVVRVTSPVATKLATPKASPSKVTKGATTTLSGKAYAKSGSKYKGYAKAKVTVQKKVGKKWKTVKTVTASTSGTWKLKVKATSTTTYRTVVKATSSKKAATSGSIKVTVRR